MEFLGIDRDTGIIDGYTAEILTDRLRRQMNGEKDFESIIFHYNNNSTTVK